ncbi:MAG: 3-isopropylmalate dehydratase [Planctomycetes bacterium]|nr:3-isopropylmalate dehydratase [Planctomycetota bacterium]
MQVKGRIFKYGDDINTDVLFPGKYTYTVKDPQEMASHAMEDLDPDFAKKVKPGDVVLGGRNFGCGSSREQAATCLKYAGVGAVVAGSFSRLFFRNAINAGLPLVQNAKAHEWIEDGETVVIDFEKGTLVCAKGTLEFPPLPEEVVGIMEAGGLVPYTRKSLGLG